MCEINPTTPNHGKGTSNTVQVIGAGWGRTGTLSLKKALEILGYNPTYHMREAIEHPKHQSFWVRVAGNLPYDFDEIFLGDGKGEPTYNATCDVPSSLYWKEQLERYPNAKVILTVRDPEKWFKSASDTIFTGISGSPNCLFGLKVLNRLGLGALTLDFQRKVLVEAALRGKWLKEDCIETFKLHNERVLRECSKERLLVFEVCEGWEPLCRFLDKPIPAEPFPHVNDTASMKMMFQSYTIFGYVVLGGLVTLPALLAWGYMSLFIEH